MSKIRTRPLPPEILSWQVALRRHTMVENNGAPHAGVAPLVTVSRPGVGMGVVSHSVICGLLPHESLLEEKTKEFQQLYEGGIEEGGRAVYDKGIEYLESYYESDEAFDPESITTLLPSNLPLVDALRANQRCALLFYVFDLEDRSEIGRLRCLQINAVAEVMSGGPVYENVWWHNTLFHGMADEHVVIHFRHESSYDTRFGRLEALASG